MSKLAFLVIALAVSGCMASPEYRARAFNAACQGYGFTPGTDGYAKCLQDQDLAFQRRVAG